MKKISWLAAGLALLLFSACHHSRHTSSGNHPKSDSLTAKKDSAEGKRRLPPQYQASATILCDIEHIRLEASFDWTKRYMYGKASITAKPYFYPQSSITLDARGMTINRVAMITQKANMDVYDPKTLPKGAQGLPQIKYDTTNLAYTYQNNKLLVELGRSYSRSESFVVYVDYIAKPDELTDTEGSPAISEDKGLYFINPDGKIKDKPKQIWTQGETQANSVWVPIIDRTNEKLTHDFFITTEDQYITLSNGLMVESKKNADGTRTDHWRMDQPHAAYLLMMATGDFAVVKDKWRDKEVNYYVEQKFAPYAKQNFGKTPAMMEYFSKTLGVDYPWPKYSQICVRDYVSGAMENTTATVHSDYLQQTDREMLDNDYEDYISHELFHQWFGDLVTCESWSNLPLNESFADWSEHLWIEHDAGLDEADHHRMTSINKYYREAATKKEPLIRYYYLSREDMFDRHSYNKGGCVLHMLRKLMGDEAFFASLKLYLEQNRYKNAEVSQLRMAFEQVTGEDLNWFFNQWFLMPGHPVLDISYAWDSTAHRAIVKMKQVQDRTKVVSFTGQTVPLFKLPMDVDVYVNGKVQRHRIAMTQPEQTFSFEASSKPDLINVDAEKILIAEKNDQHTAAEWAYMYRHAPLFFDRVEALNGLSTRDSVPDSLATVIFAEALSDKDWSVRILAMTHLKKNVTKFSTKIMQLAQNDPKAATRSQAITVLSKFVDDPLLNAMYKRKLSDQSYGVISSCIDALTDHAAAEMMTLAPTYWNEQNDEVRLSLCRLYAKNGGQENDTIFRRLLPLTDGHNRLFSMSYYGTFLQRMDNDDLTNKSFTFLRELAVDESKSDSREGVKHVLSSLTQFYGKKSAELQKKIDELVSVNPNAAGIASLREKLAAAKLMQEKCEKEKTWLSSLK